MIRTPGSIAASVMNLKSISQPDLTLIAELSVLVKVSMAFMTLALNSAYVPNDSSLM